MAHRAPDADQEARLLLERFGPGVTVVFDGPPARCPVCGGTIEQLSLILDLAGIEPAACRSCGVLLVA